MNKQLFSVVQSMLNMSNKHPSIPCTIDRHEFVNMPQVITYLSDKVLKIHKIMKNVQIQFVNLGIILLLTRSTKQIFQAILNLFVSTRLKNSLPTLAKIHDHWTNIHKTPPLMCRCTYSYVHIIDQSFSLSLSLDRSLSNAMGKCSYHSVIERNRFLMQSLRKLTTCKQYEIHIKVGGGCSYPTGYGTSQTQLSLAMYSMCTQFYSTDPALLKLLCKGHDWVPCYLQCTLEISFQMFKHAFLRSHVTAMMMTHSFMYLSVSLSILKNKPYYQQKRVLTM